MQAEAAATPSNETGHWPHSPIESLFRDRYGEFVALAATFVREPGTAEEVVQDAFAAVIARARPLDDPDKLGGYVSQAVVNGARSRLRRRAVENRPRPVHPQLSASVSDSAPDERAVALLQAVLELPARQAQCVVCRYLLEMSFSDIASTLSISPPTAKTHVRRGTAKLAVWMKEHP